MNAEPPTEKQARSLTVVTVKSLNVLEVVASSKC
jgi:hypothetical protein